MKKNITFKKAFTLGKNETQLMNVLVECASGYDVEIILKNAKNLKGTGIIIHRDQSIFLRKKSAYIRKLAKKIREINKNVEVKVKTDKLYINDNYFMVNDNNRIVTATGELDIKIISNIIGTEISEDEEEMKIVD